MRLFCYKILLISHFRQFISSKCIISINLLTRENKIFLKKRVLYIFYSHHNSEQRVWHHFLSWRTPHTVLAAIWYCWKQADGELGWNNALSLMSISKNACKSVMLSFAISLRFLVLRLSLFLANVELGQCCLRQHYSKQPHCSRGANLF